MVVVRLAGIAFPIAVAITLLGALRTVIGVMLGGDRFVGGVPAVVESLAAVWLAVMLGLPIAHRMESAQRRTGGEAVGGRPAGRFGGRTFWTMFPSILAATNLVEERLTNQLTILSVAATLLVTALFTLVVVGAFQLRDRRSSRSTT